MTEVADATQRFARRRPGLARRTGLQRPSSGVTATGARPRIPLRTGVDALTPSERRISQMAAVGSSNVTLAQELFVTIKTVEMHLTSTDRTLDIRSRAQLAKAIGDGPAERTAGL